jgi:uncharacterized protein DUF932
VRIVCANTQTAAISRAQASFGISHTGGARAALQEARRTLKLSWRYVEAFETESAQLYAQAMYLDEMRQFAAQLVDVEGADTATSARNGRDRASSIVKLWTSSPLPTAEATITPLTCADAALTCSRRWLGVGCSACPKNEHLQLSICP